MTGTSDTNSNVDVLHSSKPYLSVMRKAALRLIWRAAKKPDASLCYYFNIVPKACKEDIFRLQKIFCFAIVMGGEDMLYLIRRAIKD